MDEKRFKSEAMKEIAKQEVVQACGMKGVKLYIIDQKVREATNNNGLVVISHVELRNKQNKMALSFKTVFPTRENALETFWLTGSFKKVA